MSTKKTPLKNSFFVSFLKSNSNANKTSSQIKHEASHRTSFFLKEPVTKNTSLFEITEPLNSINPKIPAKNINYTCTDNYFQVSLLPKQSLFVKKEDADFFNFGNLKEQILPVFQEKPKKVFKEINKVNFLNDQNVPKNANKLNSKTEETVFIGRILQNRFNAYDRSQVYKMSFIEQPPKIYEAIRKIY